MEFRSKCNRSKLKVAILFTFRSNDAFARWNSALRAPMSLNKTPWELYAPLEFECFRSFHWNSFHPTFHLNQLILLRLYVVHHFYCKMCENGTRQNHFFKYFELKFVAKFVAKSINAFYRFILWARWMKYILDCKNGLFSFESELWMERINFTQWNRQLTIYIFNEWKTTIKPNCITQG